MLPTGTRLGAYEIQTQIGSGGMGEVYRAHDTKLARDVAVKVLPKAFARDPERLARFKREAHVLASLNHPNIAHIYGFEECDGSHALVMELVEGSTLADQIARRGNAQRVIEANDALSIARQIIDALEAAHEQGIVHRDLKPANIKVREDGTVKVLDFGLAKAFAPEGPITSADYTNEPTLTSPDVTALGTLLGTAAYMAPEQARGKRVDQRADIWAFGCVLFEMLAGKPAFGDTDVSLTLSNVLRGEPDFAALPDDVRGPAREVVRFCLRKEPRQRISDVRDVRLMLDGVFQTDATSNRATSTPAPSRWRGLLVVAAASAIVAALAGGLAVWRFRPASVAESTRFEEMLVEGLDFRDWGRRVVAISPDGRRILFNATRGLFIREMDEFAPHLIPGTEAAGTLDPAFSPDGRSIAYVQGGQLKRIAITGGQPVPICPATPSFGVSWNRDGTIVYGQTDGVWRVSENGNTPTKVVEPEPGERVSLAQVVPGGEWMLMTSTKDDGSSQVVARSLGSTERKVLVSGAAQGLYVEPGYLLYLTAGGLMATAFDRRTMEKRGSPVSLFATIGTGTTTGEAQLSVSDNGSLVYLPGSLVESRKLMWVDRKGTPVGDVGVAGLGVEHPSLSPNERFVVYSALEDANRHVFRYDMTTTTKTRLSVSAANDRPVWSPGGALVAFNTIATGTLRDIVARPSDAGGPIDTMVSLPGHDYLGDWWKGKGTDEYLLFDRQGGEGGLWYLKRTSPASAWEAPQQLLAGPGVVVPKLSPNGRYVAYLTMNPIEVWVMPFPSGDRRWKISSNGGRRIRWSRDGTELFYVQGQDLMSVRVSMTGDLSPGRPDRLFPWPGLAAGSLDNPSFDVSGDGRRFLVIESPRATRPAISVVLNWKEELKRLVPAQ